jgi:hypothetical protein
MAYFKLLLTEWKRVMPRSYIPKSFGAIERPDRTAPTQRAMTLEEIADVFGTSRERIRQIEQMALRKIRGRLRARGIDIKDYLPD